MMEQGSVELVALEECDNGQNDVVDGSVENYDFDWGESLPLEISDLPLDDELITLDEQSEISDNNL